MDKNYGFDTLQLHAGWRGDPATGAHAAPLYQTSAYLFNNAEDAAMQERSVALFTTLRDAPEAESKAFFDVTLDFARKHQAVIERFGRFPHRNAILGRASTVEELDYLAQPGAGF